MKLNHLNLTVSDAAETAAFLAKYFGMQPMAGAPVTPAMAFLTDENGMILSLMRGKRDEEPEYPGYFHIGFIQPNHEGVNEVNRRLKADGFDVPEPGHFHGSWTFYFKAPGGVTVEVLA